MGFWLPEFRKFDRYIASSFTIPFWCTYFLFTESFSSMSIDFLYFLNSTGRGQQNLNFLILHPILMQNDHLYGAHIIPHSCQVVGMLDAFVSGQLEPILVGMFTEWSSRTFFCIFILEHTYFRNFINFPWQRLKKQRGNWSTQRKKTPL
jgi:hypothetical protein